MRKFKIFVLVTLLFFQTALIARVVNENEALTVSLKLIQFENQCAELRLTKDTFSFKEITPLVYKGEQIGYIAHLLPQGFMIFPGITELSPVKFVCFSGNFEEIKDHPFIRQILERIYYTRVRLNFHGESKVVFPDPGNDPIDTIQVAKNEGIWEKYLLDEVTDHRLSDTASIDAVSPLLTSRWSQGVVTTTGNAYNMYTPTIDGKHTYTGCSATAQAQVMYYWKYPTYGQGSHSYIWNSQTLSADFNHEYYWSQMVDEYDGTQTPQQEDAVATLMSDVGISINMNYGLGGSGAYINDNDSLQTFFKYSDDIQTEYRILYASWDAWFYMFKQQMDNGWPAILATYKPGSGHAIVVDGYRTVPSNQVHVNMGWGGYADDYYTIDDVYGYGDPLSDSAVINIHPPKEITVISPNGGETWPLGSPQKITWTSSGLTGTVKLILFKDGAFIGTVAHGIPVTDGEYNWTVGNHSLGTASPGAGYVVRVKSIENKDIFDDSDAPFTISYDSCLTLIAPNGGETWALGSTQKITWTSSGLTGTVKLILFNGGTFMGTIAHGIDVTDGEFDWTVGNHSLGTASPGAGYVVRVKSIENKTCFDDSDAPFTISDVSSLELTCPNGGETWALGSTQKITWTSSGLTGTVKLVLFKGGALMGTIAHGIDVTDGEFDWTVGNHSLGTALPGTGYVVRVKSIENKAYCDDSDAPFTISGLVLTSPNGGETWQQGSAQKITWASGGITGTVKLVLFKNGTRIGTIYHGIDVTVGEFNWTVGDYIGGTASPGTGYVVRVKLIEDKTYWDDSDGGFEISSS